MKPTDVDKALNSLMRPVHKALNIRLKQVMKEVRIATIEECAKVAIQIGRMRCQSRGVNPDSEVFSHDCDHIRAMGCESMGCSEDIADTIRRLAEEK
jgi:hypothetical protein